MRKLALISSFIFILTFNAEAQNDRSLFFSEYCANGFSSALEIFNPTSDTIQLNQYSIVRNGVFRFDFPGGVLLPYSTWVGCRNEPLNPPDPRVLAVADTSWPATGSIWYLGSSAKIELLKDDIAIDIINGTPLNGTVAGVTYALDKHTLIRKPGVSAGITSWDLSRGTDPYDSQWFVYEVVYTELGKHFFDFTYPAFDTIIEINSDIFPVYGDTIYLDSETPADSIIANMSATGNCSFVLQDLSGNPTNSGLVSNGYRAKVFNQAGSYTSYFFKILASDESMIQLESLICSIRNDSITNISTGTNVNSFLSRIMLFPSGVTAKVTDHSGIEKTDGIVTGDILKLIAKDGITERNFMITCFSPVPPAQFQVHNIAKVRSLPIGAPAYSDVNMTTRWARTNIIRTGPEALPAARSFHGTNFRWSYVTNNASGNYPRIDNWIRNDILGNGFKISAAVNPTIPDLPRGGGKSYDSRAETLDGTLTSTFCPNKPMGRQAFINHVLAAVQMSADFSIQMDDPHSYSEVDSVCYCNYCRNTAKEWGMVVGSSAFRSKSVAEFWKWVQEEITNYTGKDIGLSCNNSSNHLYDQVTKNFDFMIGECDPRWGYGPEKYFADERISAEGLGKMQVFNLSVKGLVLEDSTLVWRNRSIIGLSYGIGSNCIVPWDSYMHPPIEERRYFGKPEEYSDLFGFIRANTRLLEKYETAFDYMPAYTDTRYGGGKPVTITGNDRAFAFVRAIPGDSSAAVVVHLVDWKETAPGLPFTVNIKPEYFFSGGDFGVFLVEPVKYNQIIQQEVIGNADRILKPGTYRGAEHEAVYSPLRKIQKLNFVREESVIRISIDSIPTYAMLVLVPATQKLELSSDSYSVDENALLIKGYNSAEYTSEFLNKIVRNPLTSWMVMDQDGEPVYDNITSNSSLIVLSPEGRKIKEYALEQGSEPVISIFNKQSEIKAGQIFEVVPVAKGLIGETYSFTIINNSDKTFIADTILLNNSSFVLNYDFNQILSGDSAVFNINFKPLLSAGSQECIVSILDFNKGNSPFKFTVTGLSLSSGIEVYNKVQKLNPGTGVLNLGEIKVDRDTVVTLSVVNPGNLTLNISEISVKNSESLTIEYYDNQIEPLGTGIIRMKYSPSVVSWETIQLTIFNNSAFFPLYKLNVEGTGLELAPKQEISYNSVIFSNNSGLVDFGIIDIDSICSRKVVIRNSGVDNLIISGMISGMPEFKILSDIDIIKAGESDTIIIEFNPAFALSYSTYVKLYSNDKNFPVFSFTVKGKGNTGTSAGIRENAKILIYPNPATSEVKVCASGEFTIRLLTLKGEIIQYKRVCLEECHLDLNGLKGMYIIEICNSNQVFIEKLIVN